jgi:hypothetical protein
MDVESIPLQELTMEEAEGIGFDLSDWYDKYNH